MEFTFEDFEVNIHGKKGYVPVKPESGDVGYDIHTPEDIYLPHMCRRMIDTGVVIETPEPLFYIVVPRSSTGTKRAKEVRIANTVGIIDPSYCGKNDTLKVCLVREGLKQEFIGTLQPDPTLDKSLEKQAMVQLGIRTPANVPTSNATESKLSHYGLHLVKRGDGKFDVFGYESKDDNNKIFSAGDRFVQAIFIPFSRPDLVEKSLTYFEKEGRGGFGSTGT